MISASGSAAPGPPEALGTEEVRQLMAIGLHAVYNGRPEAALLLFDALDELRPDKAFPSLGRAQAMLAMGHAADAVRVLEAASQTHPDDDDVLSYLGMALQCAQRPALARAVLERVLARNGQKGSHAADMARSLLDLSASSPARAAP